MSTQKKGLDLQNVNLKNYQQQQQQQKNEQN